MKDIKVIVAEAEINRDDGSYDECMCSLGFNQAVYSLDELFAEDWFLATLKDRGFYSKNEIAGESGQYLDKFIYEYRDSSFPYYTKNIKDISVFYNITGVYQEVIGPERIKAYDRWKKERQTYLKKEADLKAKKLERAEQAKEKRRLKAVEKARKILEKEGNGINKISDA